MEITIRFKINNKKFFEQVDLLNNIPIDKEILDGLTLQRKYVPLQKKLIKIKDKTYKYGKVDINILLDLITTDKQNIGSLYRNYMMQDVRAVSYRSIQRVIKCLYIRELICVEKKIGGYLGTTTFIWLREDKTSTPTHRL